MTVVQEKPMLEHTLHEYTSNAALQQRIAELEEEKRSLRDQLANLLRPKMRLEHSDLRGVDLRGRDLEEIQLFVCDLKGANFSGANLEGAFLHHCNLKNADFSDANLNGAVLSHSHFGSAILEGASLSNATLHYADLTRVHARGVDLSGADMFGARLLGGNFQDSNMERVVMIGADVRGARFWNARMTGAQFPSVPMMLSANWGGLSESLTIELMAYDADNHPSPGLFDEWAESDFCPFEHEICDVDRAALFQERRYLWESQYTPTMTGYQLLMAVLAEVTKDWKPRSTEDG